MPTYEYQCEKCRKKFEVIQSMTAAPVKKCPTCKGKVKRLIGLGGGFIFKGSGFYITDYRSKAYQDQAKKEKSESAPKAESKTETKTESKPETKSEPGSTGPQPKKKKDSSAPRKE